MASLLSDSTIVRPLIVLKAIVEHVRRCTSGFVDAGLLTSSDVNKEEAAISKLFIMVPILHWSHNTKNGHWGSQTRLPALVRSAVLWPPSHSFFGFQAMVGIRSRQPT